MMAFQDVVFNKVENGLIFTSDYRTFVRNNTISFSNAGIAVVYGPNGTGKTSLAKVFDGTEGTAMSCEYNSVVYENGKDLFHVINDQNNRNIISGSTKDFLLGDNIRKEFELQQFTSEKYQEILIKVISQLKDTFKISTVSNPLIPNIQNTQLSGIVKDLANKSSKGSKTAIKNFLEVISSLPNEELPAICSNEKFTYFVNEYSDKKSILHKVLTITEPDITKVHNAQEIEENSVAIDILTQFSHRTKCIVCDADGIDSEKLKEEKTQHRQLVIDSLTKQLRTFIKDIVALPSLNDPYSIRENVLRALEEGNFVYIKTVQEDIKQYVGFFNIKLNSSLKSDSDIRELNDKYVEYEKIISEKPDITEEDFIYIEEILSNSMDKKIAVTRDSNKNLKILLEEKEFLGLDREKLPLSTGEQNFLSLCFEFLKAKNSKNQIIVLDDPISSFDSIYKNKVVFALVKMLESKPRIVLTHNLDLLRLLESQYKHSFNLYLLNNTEGEDNGFIPLSNNEQNMLINLKELLNTFRHKIFNDINSSELYLISMIPFMRGYATIIDDKNLIEQLTQLMHGYKTASVDIAKIYFQLFGNDGSKKLPNSLKVNVSDILSKTVDGISIVNPVKYPLLNKTLKHSFVYLFLRLLVEKTLVEKYTIDTNRYDQLGSIISQAFPGNDVDSIRKRVRLTSKKTLINEFNHFEGNLSIFQPAIDITEKALGTEKTDILTFIDTINKS